MSTKPIPSEIVQPGALVRHVLPAVLLLLAAPLALGHIVPPEKLHPVAESYRRLGFLLSLNPVPWTAARADALAVAEGLAAVSPPEAEIYRLEALAVIAPLLTEGGIPEPERRKAASGTVFELSTSAVARTLTLHLEAAREALGSDHRKASAELTAAREIWAAFEPGVRAADSAAHHHIGECWLQMSSALGSPGLFGVGAVEPDRATFERETAEMIEYLEQSFLHPEKVQVASTAFVPLPAHSPTFEPGAAVPLPLPPGAEINKQLPRPRQILNMAARGVDESETPLIALGDMAFDSAEIFGEPARSLTLSCNTCHNKGVTNPKFFVPGLSARPGSLDVSNSFFAPHANNGHFDPLDIPDLRGLRFTAPYGRNGRFESLREFSRNVIVNEFNGPEPDPLLLDGLVAYMLEFDFLPNPLLAPDGRLTPAAPEAARRGEAVFNRPFAQLGDRSCATCHVPSDSFLDRKRHDIGTVGGAEEASRDRTLDTPTLLGSAYTAPYFHDGSQPTLGSVVDWFDDAYSLTLSERERADLTAYLETVGAGTDAYEDTLYTLDSELEEFSFFLSTYELLKSRGKPELIGITLATVATELDAHKWDLQDTAHMGVLDRMVELIRQAREAHARGDVEATETHLAAYRRLYEDNAEVLR